MTGPHRGKKTAQAPPNFGQWDLCPHPVLLILPGMSCGSRNQKSFATTAVWTVVESPVMPPWNSLTTTSPLAFHTACDRQALGIHISQLKRSRCHSHSQGPQLQISDLLLSPAASLSMAQSAISTPYFYSPLLTRL